MQRWQHIWVSNMETALWFSGGKDSLACLLLYRAQLSEIDVLWANTGRNLPEVEDFIHKISGLCPRWHEVKVDRNAQWRQHGLPSDLVPVDNTSLGEFVSSIKPVRIQSYLQCCFQNIAAPLVLKTKQLGARIVIRGQRLEEAHRAPEGEINGMVFVHPIAKWSAANVMDYLRTAFGQLPDHYALDHSSVDCFDCTAYAAHVSDRAEYMRNRHPAKHKEYMMRLSEVGRAISEPLKAYEKLGAFNA